MEELKGDPADFDEEEFAEELKNDDKVLEYKKDRKIEMRVSIDAQTLSKDDLDKAKKQMEASIKEAINDKAVIESSGAAEVADVKCGNSSFFGTKTNIVCRITTKDAEKATRLEGRSRKPEFASKLKEKFNAKSKGRRLNNERRLSAIPSLDVDSSQKLTTGAVSVDSSQNVNVGGSSDPNKGTSDKSLDKSTSATAPAPAGNDESILSSSGKCTISIMCATVAMLVAQALF